MTRDTISHEMRRVLDQELRVWYPLCIDTVHGGFFSDINFRWELDGTQNKMIVTQARHVWSTANASMFYRKDNSFNIIAKHGVDFLKKKMWDHSFGGFYDLVDREGTPILEGGEIVKRAYGNAFAIYGLSAYYRASGDSSALRLAQETFLWLEKHSYDQRHGGYFQFMTRAGAPFVHGYRGTPPKDQNSMIHLLECFTELFRVWPDSLLKERLRPCLSIIRDTITTDKGYMTLFFQSDWTPVSYRDSSVAVRQSHYDLDHVSFGHDIETGYLMLEATEALGNSDDPVTFTAAKRMIDHGMNNGWDNDNGGIYDGGYYLPGETRPSIVRNTKEWWSQVEALNSFLMMSQLLPAEEARYFERFCAQWSYCKKSLLDGEHGGWYWGGVDVVPGNRYSAKGSIWKGNYHTSRALINCIRRLETNVSDTSPSRDHGDRN